MAAESSAEVFTRADGVDTHPQVDTFYHPHQGTGAVPTELYVYAQHNRFSGISIKTHEQWQWPVNQCQSMSN
jgi:hypothetical protein